MNRFSCLSRVALSAALLLLSSGVARAGFEFIPGPSRQSTPPASLAPAEPAGMNMTPAPAGTVVSEALGDAMAQRVPQSLVPPSSVQSAPVSRSTPSLSIDMNPLSRGSHNPGDTGLSASLAQAMVNESGMSMSRAGLGGMALPPRESVATTDARYSMTPPVLSSAPPANYSQSAPLTEKQGSAAYQDAIGFGRDLPLPLAVSQIVPPDYAFNFAGNINAGDTVSWEGGKPWNVVLSDALAAIGATAQIDDARKEITINAGGGSVAAISPSPAAAPVQQASLTPPPPSSAAAIVVPLMERHVSEVAVVPPTMVSAAGAKVSLSGLNNVAVLDPAAEHLWEAVRGTTLRDILTNWSSQAGVELFWSSDYDFPVESSIRIKGTYEEAVQTLLNGLRDAQPRPIGRLHPNLPEGPSVLVIETKHILE